MQTLLRKLDARLGNGTLAPDRVDVEAFELGRFAKLGYNQALELDQVPHKQDCCLFRFPRISRLSCELEVHDG